MYGRRQEEERVPRRRLGLRDGGAHGGVAQTAEGAKAAEEAREAIKELGPKRREVSCSLRTHALVGKALRKYAAPARGLRRRGCFAEIERYLELPCPGRVLILFGLRGTGKTTLIRQALLSLSKPELMRAALIQVGPGDTKQVSTPTSGGSRTGDIDTSSSTR